MFKKCTTESLKITRKVEQSPRKLNVIKSSPFKIVAGFGDGLYSVVIMWHTLGEIL